MTTYLDVWDVLHDRCERLGPVDLRSGWPLVSDNDLVALARRWSAAIEHHADALDDHDGLRRWWRHQVEQLAEHSPPDRVAAFWEASFDLAAELTNKLSERRPRDAAKVTTDDKGAIRISGTKAWDEVHTALRVVFAERRGFDTYGDSPMRWPRTTNDDIRQLTAMWDSAVAKPKRTDLFGFKGARDKWREVSDEAKRLTKGADSNAVYPQNLKFWKTSFRLAVKLQQAVEEPPEIEFWDALGKNIKAAPGRIADVLSTAGGAVGGAAKDVAGGVADVAAGAISKVGKPLLIGAGVVGAAALAIVVLRK